MNETNETNALSLRLHPALLRLLLRRVVIFASVAAIAAAAITQFLPRIYRSTAKILPSDAGSGLPFGELLGTDLSAVLAARGSGQNPVATYPEILVSWPVLENTLALEVRQGNTVLDALHVRGRSNRVRQDQGITALRRLVKVNSNPRTGVIAITADTGDPSLSAFVANGLVDNLNRFNIDARRSRSRAVREFVEGRLHETASALAESEQAMARFRASNLRIGNSPNLVLDQQRLERQVEVQADLYRLLERQYEQARIEEQRDTPTFTLLERALPPVKKYRPSTFLNVVAAAVAATAVAVVVSLMNSQSFLKQTNTVSTP